MPGDDLNLLNEEEQILELDTNISSMSDDEFSRLMSGEEEPTAEGGKETAPATKSKPEAAKPKAETAKPAKAAATKAATQQAPTSEEGIDSVDDLEDFMGDEVAAKGKKDGEVGDETDDDGSDELDDETARIMMSNTYNHLVKTGIWSEVEGEGFDPNNMTPEEYAQIAVQQANEAAHQAFSELMDRTGKYRTILDHAMRNGNPEEIINLFKEEQYNNSLDIKVPADQKEMIRRYHNNILEWDKNDTEGFINKAEADNELEKYAVIADKGYKKHIEAAVKTKNAEMKAKEDEATNNRLIFVDTMNSAIDDLKISVDKKEFLRKAILTPSLKVSANKTITPFQAQMLKIQQNPKEYIELVRFVMDKKAYLESATVKKENKETQGAFKIKLNNGGTGGIKAEVPARRQSNSKEREELNFFTPNR